MPALMTPCFPDRSVNYEALVRKARELIDVGIPDDLGFSIAEKFVVFHQPRTIRCESTSIPIYRRP